MRIKWNNIFLTGLFITLLVVLSNLLPAVGDFLDRMDWHSLHPADRLIMSLSLGLVCLTAIAVAKIMAGRRH